MGTATRTPTGDVATGTAIAFTAAATDADGDLLSYAWDFGNGSTSTAQNPSFTYTTAGTYTAKVTVSDGRGGTDSKTLPVVVTQPNRAPTVTGSRTPTGVVAPGTSIAFTATGTDADSDTLTYSWDFGDSTAASTAAEPVAHVHHRGHVHRQGDRHRRQGRDRHGGHPGDRCASRAATTTRRSRGAHAHGQRRASASRSPSPRPAPTPTATR